MTTKQFAEEAIKNGFKKEGLCEGWDWIREKLAELDYVFRAEEYKAQDGMQYKCMPFLLTDITLTELEKEALGVAWFCNNERIRKEKDEAYKTKMIEAGYLPLTEEIVRQAYKNKNKLLVVAEMSMDWFSQKREKTYKPFVDKTDKCWLMEPLARRKGYYLYQFKNAFCKIV